MRHAALLGAVLLAGCGGERIVTATVTIRSAPARACSSVSESGILLCQVHAQPFTTAFFAQRRGRLRPLRVARPAGAKVGHWATAYLSPDRRTLLAQWSAECEVPIAFFVPAHGGTPHVVSGERDWAQAPESIAQGWTSDGRAIIEFPQGACGSSADRPGLYLVSLAGGRRLLTTLPRRPGP